MLIFFVTVELSKIQVIKMITPIKPSDINDQRKRDSSSFPPSHVMMDELSDVNSQSDRTSRQ